MATTLTQLGQQAAGARGTTLITVDLASTSTNDPNGTAEFYCIAFLMLGDAIGATVLGRVAGQIRVRAVRSRGWSFRFAVGLRRAARTRR